MKTRDQIADEVASSLNIQKSSAREIVAETFKVLGASLKQGVDVRVHEFGTFQVKDTAARTGRNPSTGEPIDIAAGRKVTWKPSSDLKKSI